MTIEKYPIVFSKINLEILYQTIQLNQITLNSDYGNQIIVLFIIILEKIEDEEILQFLYEGGLIDYLLNHLNSKKINENILKYLLIFSCFLTDKNLKNFLNENQVKFIL